MLLFIMMKQNNFFQKSSNNCLETKQNWNYLLVRQTKLEYKWVNYNIWKNYKTKANYKLKMVNKQIRKQILIKKEWIFKIKEITQ